MRLRSVDPDERLALVDHLGELRARILLAGAVLGATCGLCFWQNHLLLDLLNAPLPTGREPVTFSPTEPFMTTLKVSAYAGVLLALPVILHQGYAFALPALSPAEKRAIGPFLVLIPLLFVAGVVFGYLVVLPAAASFLLQFNDAQFEIQVRASEYYGFASTTLIAMGLVFQVPVATLALTRLSITTPAALARGRRYAYFVLAVVAMLLPGTDPVTMLIELAPLLALYEASIVLARALGSPPDRGVATEGSG